MENHALDPTIILGVNINCCEKCPMKLKKKLLQIDGVYWVDVDVEQKKKLFTVTGKVDPTILIEYIRSTGKTAELLYYKKNPNTVNNNHHRDGKEQSKSSKNVKAKMFENEKKKNVGESRSRRERRSHGLFRDSASPHKKDNGHIIEDYEAPKIDPSVCRDPYCKLHKSRPIIHNKVHSKDNADHPHHTAGYPFFRGSGSQSFRLDNHFPYDHPMMEPPPPPTSFGLHPGAHYTPRYDENFSYYGNAANFRGWPM